MENHESKSMGHVMRLHDTQHASPTQDQKEIRQIVRYRHQPHYYHHIGSNAIIFIVTQISKRVGNTCNTFSPRVNDFFIFDFLCLLFFGIKLLDCLRMNL
jgi:hypothetical protein